MEIVNKCSFEDHKEKRAFFYCLDCKVYMCNKCEIFHSKLLKNHQKLKVEETMGKNIEETFTGFCKEEKHNNNELEYFCKTHNKLCCASCLCKIKNKGNGKHKDCEVCNLEDIKDEKLNKLKENLNLLEELSNTLKDSTNQLKIVFENINKNKEEIKLKIQKIFTIIRNELNNREDFLLLEIDKQFENVYFNEDIIKKSENFPNQIKSSLEKGKNIEKENNFNNNLNSLIYKCIKL